MNYTAVPRITVIAKFRLKKKMILVLLAAVFLEKEKGKGFCRYESVLCHIGIGNPEYHAICM